MPNWRSWKNQKGILGRDSSMMETGDTGKRYVCLGTANTAELWSSRGWDSFRAGGWGPAARSAVPKSTFWNLRTLDIHHYLGCCLVANSCLTLCDPMDCSLPGSSVHRILQARILEWVAFPPPGDLPDLWIELTSPALAGRFFTTEPPGKLVI